MTRFHERYLEIALEETLGGVAMTDLTISILQRLEHAPRAQMYPQARRNTAWLYAAAALLLFVCGVGVWQWQAGRGGKGGGAGGETQVTPPFGGKTLTHAEKQELVAKASHNTHDFAFKLFHTAMGQEPGKNVVLSPASAAFALAMSYNGAEGKTREEFEKLLALDGMTREEANIVYNAWLSALQQEVEGCQMSLANSVWVNVKQRVLDAYVQRLSDVFNAEAAALDFSDAATAVGLINRWVDKQTAGRIKDLVSERDVNASTMACVINTIYMKADWMQPFKKEKTEDRRFTLADGETIDVPTLAAGEYWEYLKTNDFQAVRLPYVNENLRMVVMLPAEASSPEALAGQLTSETWASWSSEFFATDVNLTMPKLKVEAFCDLVPVLEAMGFVTAFRPGAADFSAMSPDGKAIYISSAYQKAFLQVDEEGTEAAAATVIIHSKGGEEPDGEVMRVDRPYLLAIEDVSTNSLLFLAAIYDPRTE